MGQCRYISSEPAWGLHPTCWISSCTVKKFRRMAEFWCTLNSSLGSKYILRYFSQPDNCICSHNCKFLVKIIVSVLPTSTERYFSQHHFSTMLKADCVNIHIVDKRLPRIMINSSSAEPSAGKPPERIPPCAKPLIAVTVSGWIASYFSTLAYWVSPKRLWVRFCMYPLYGNVIEGNTIQYKH